MQGNYLSCFSKEWNLALRRGSSGGFERFKDFTVFQNLTPESRYSLPIHTTKDILHLPSGSLLVNWSSSSLCSTPEFVPVARS